MCRFLLVTTSGTPLADPAALLLPFAEMCRARSARGEWQGDGWGIAWLTADNGWALHKSTRPIWEETARLRSTPPTLAFAAHARSASFDKGKGDAAYNQPYLLGSCAFVFNGLLRGVALPKDLGRAARGDIGAQRIGSLIQRLMDESDAPRALSSVARLLETHSREVVACNIGLLDARVRRIYASCRYSQDGDYYQMRWHTSESLRLVCSEPLPGYACEDVPTGRVLVL